MAKTTEVTELAETINETLPDTTETVPEYVVLKGNRVHHNGVVYQENKTIPVSGVHAERLIKLGIIANISELRERLLAAASGVSITSE